MHNGLLTKEKWENFSIYMQLGNIGSEVGRAFKYKKAGKTELAQAAFFRAWELFDATLSDKKNKLRLKEINICRELFSDIFFSRHEYKETPENFENYFNQIAVIAKDPNAHWN